MSYPPDLSATPGPSRSRPTSPLLNGEAKDEEEVEEVLGQIKRYEDFSTVDWIQDSLRERYARVNATPRTNSILHRLDNLEGPVGYIGRAIVNILEEGETWVVISLVGVAIGVTMGIISITSVWLSDIKLGYCTTGWWLNRKFCCLEVSDEGESCAEWRNWGGVEPFRYIFYIIYAAMFSFSAAYLVRGFAPYAAGSGISEIKCILGGFIIKGFLSFSTTAVKALTLPLTIASGLSVGKEGPSVHYACGIGNVVGRLFQRYDRSASKMRDIVTSASAAGVAVAFGSPIGGVLFSIEEMNQGFSTRTMWQSFVCALVATFTLASMDPFRTGKLVLFTVSYDRDWHYFEIPAYVLLGVFGGLYGVFVIKFNIQVASFRRKHLKEHGVLEAVSLASLTAVIGYLNRFLRIDMTECMEVLFRECEGGGDRHGLCQTSAQWRMINSLLLGTIVRTALVIISYGAKVPCGIFVPSMAVGAMFGRMVGILMKAMHTAFPDAPWFAVCAPDAPCITPGTYAFLGAAACLGGVTKLTVTVVVIMFELTGALTYILPTMIVLLVMKAVSDSFGGAGIADQMIRFNGFPFLEKEDKDSGDHSFIEPIGNVMKRTITMMRADGMPISQIEEIVQSTNYQGYPVVRGEFDRTIVGMVNKTDLRYALERARRARAVSHSAICTFQSLPSTEADENGLLAQPDIVIPGRKASTARSPTMRTFSDTIHNTPGTPGLGRAPSLSAAEQVDFGQYVDETPLTVSPKMPLEIVMQLFRRMGPRVILVATEGHLVGLVTIKDLLRYEAKLEHRKHKEEESLSALPSHLRSSRRGRGIRRDSQGSENSSVDSQWGNGNWTPVGDDGVVVQGEPHQSRGLEVTLEEGLRWIVQKFGGVVESRSGRRTPIGNEGRNGVGVGTGTAGGQVGRNGQHEDAMEYELAEEGPPR